LYVVDYATDVVEMTYYVSDVMSALMTLKDNLSIGSDSLPPYFSNVLNTQLSYP